MDIKTDPLTYSPLIQKQHDPGKILASIDIVMQSAQAYEFRTTCIKPLVNEVVMASIGQHIKGAMLYALQRFQNIGVLNPDFFRQNDCEYTDKELMCLKIAAESWVARCVIR